MARNSVIWLPKIFNFTHASHKSMDFFESIRQGQLNEVKRQVASDPDLLTARDPRGFPSLALASYGGQVAITQFLLEAGADVNVRDAADNTALIGVSFKGYPEIASLLLAHGANTEAQNVSGATALIYAVTFGQIEIVRLLLAHGADPTRRDEAGHTAADHAS